MTDIAKHLRIVDKDPTDEFVEKRITAINELSDSYRTLSSVPDILHLANDLSTSVAARGSLPEARTEEIEGAIKRASSAFTRDGQTLQISTCALLAALQYLETADPSSNTWTRADVLACGVWSALSFQTPRSEPRIEHLRVELMNRARDLVLQSSSRARKRESVPDVQDEKSPPSDLAELVENCQATVEPLRTNAALDREELDFLWWVLSDWSSILDRRLSGAPPLIAAISAGIEAAALLRRLPGEAHKQIVLRNIESDRLFTLAEVIDELGKDKQPIQAHLPSSELLSTCPRVFPLLSTISGRDVTAAAKNKLSVHDWGARALLEAAIIRLATLSKVLV